METKREIYRHGDVILIPLEDGELKDEWSEHDSYILAYGEVTGHCHTLTALGGAVAIMKGFNNRTYVKLKTKGELTHQEHKKLIIEPDVYEIKNEREWDYITNTLTKVID